MKGSEKTSSFINSYRAGISAIEKTRMLALKKDKLRCAIFEREPGVLSI